MCFLKYPVCENDFPQDSHLWSLWPSWIEWMWFFKWSARENDLPQDAHIWSLWPSWIVWMCLFKYLSSVNDLQQNLHLIFLWPSWNAWMCLNVSATLSSGHLLCQVRHLTIEKLYQLFLRSNFHVLALLGWAPWKKMWNYPENLKSYLEYWNPCLLRNLW